MASYSVRETFFRPPEHSRQASALPADLYNALQLLFKGQPGACVFVPIRSMQYQAVVEREEVIFVDSQGGYGHQDGEGGRLIGELRGMLQRALKERREAELGTGRRRVLTLVRHRV